MSKTSYSEPLFTRSEVAEILNMLEDGEVTNQILLESSFNDSNSIYIYTAGGNNEMITISSVLGTLSNSININS